MDTWEVSVHGFTSLVDGVVEDWGIFVCYFPSCRLKYEPVLVTCLHMWISYLGFLVFGFWVLSYVSPCDLRLWVFLLRLWLFLEVFWWFFLFLLEGMSFEGCRASVDKSGWPMIIPVFATLDGARFGTSWLDTIPLRSMRPCSVGLLSVSL